MSDLPKAVRIQEEGPREGFQIEKRLIPTQDKLRFIEALGQTGLRRIQCVSFVDPRRVPQMADAEDVARGLKQRAGVEYTGLWLNLRGFERAVTTPLHLAGKLQISASEAFSVSNTGRDTKSTLEEQGRLIDAFVARGLSIDTTTVMTAFGCNFAGEIPPSLVVERIRQIKQLGEEHGVALNRFSLADTVGWGNPQSVARVIGAVRERWPDLQITLHLHDTRGTGLPNALMGLMLGIDSFDSACAGLGGCPFAEHKGAAGNICTEDFVHLCHEMGIETGIDLDALIGCARLAEEIFDHALPGKIMHAGSLSRFRAAKVAANV